MLVSVLIPVYNVEAYVEVAVRSILEQTYTNLEVLIVDDCSTDRTYEICLNLANIDKRIRVYRNDSNRKISFTLNRALSESSGELIARMDGDDISEPDRIEKKVDFLRRNPDVDLVGCSVYSINPKGEIIGKTTHYSDFDFLKRTLKYVTPCSHIWVARREMYEKLFGYRDIPGAEDYDFLLRAITSGYRITNLQDYFGYKVRLARSGNTSHSIGAKQRLLQRYVFDLYSQRLRCGIDSHSDAAMNAATRQPSLSKFLFNVSNRNLLKSIQATGFRRLHLRLFYLLLSLCSPIQVNYLYSRVRYRTLCFLHKK